MYNKAFHDRTLSDKTFLVTGGAGFIGSNLVEYLIKYGAKKVRVIDNLSTGFLENISQYLENSSFEFINGDIRSLDDCLKACEGIDYISHQAALGSVPRSIEDPISTNSVNINGFLNILMAGKDCMVKRIVYAASSSTYGDSMELPKKEDIIGKPLSPYAITKYVNELYADVFSRIYGLQTIGLRYFNIFGPRQNPHGEYAAVIPNFIKSVKERKPAIINGDGETTRDFTFVENAVQANIKALLVDDYEAINQVYNVACGEATSLNQLWQLINDLEGTKIESIYRESRKGDIRHSLAEIDKIKEKLNYNNYIDVKAGLRRLFNESSE